MVWPVFRAVNLLDLGRGWWRVLAPDRALADGRVLYEEGIQPSAAVSTYGKAGEGAMTALRVSWGRGLVSSGGDHCVMRSGTGRAAGS